MKSHSPLIPASLVHGWVIYSGPKKNSNKGLTFDRHIDLIRAINYNELVQHGRVQNSYEIMIAVMGITIEKNNLDPFQVYINSAFVDDLGINQNPPA